MATMTKGMFGNSPFYAPPPPGAPLPDQGTPGAGMTPRTPSFFEQGGVGRGIAGTIGDYLLQQAHMQPVYAPAQQQARAQQLQQQRYAQQQQDEQAQWLARQEYERSHPKPVNNDTVNDFQFIAQTLGPDVAKQYLGNVAAGPPMAVDAVDPVTGNTVRQYIPRQSLPGMGQPQAAPQGQILQQLPPGVKPIGPGGAGPQAPRTFR